MKMLRTMSWFLILVLLLAAFVSFTLAQEPPTVDEGQFFHQDLSEPLSSEPIVPSSEATEIELSSTSRYSLSLPAASVSLAPAMEDIVPQEQVSPVKPPVLPLPEELQDSHVLGGTSPIEIDVPYSIGGRRAELAGHHVGLPQVTPAQTGGICNQLLSNPHLDMGDGSFAPWIILDPRVYFIY